MSAGTTTGSACRRILKGTYVIVTRAVVLNGPKVAARSSENLPGQHLPFEVIFTDEKSGFPEEGGKHVVMVIREP